MKMLAQSLQDFFPLLLKYFLLNLLLGLVEYIQASPSTLGKTPPSKPFSSSRIRIKQYKSGEANTLFHSSYGTSCFSNTSGFSSIHALLHPVGKCLCLAKLVLLDRFSHRPFLQPSLLEDTATADYGSAHMQEGQPCCQFLLIVKYFNGPLSSVKISFA